MKITSQISRKDRSCSGAQTELLKGVGRREDKKLRANIHDGKICFRELQFRERVESVPFLRGRIAILVDPPFLALIGVAGNRRMYQSYGLCSEIEEFEAMD